MSDFEALHRPVLSPPLLPAGAAAPARAFRSTDEPAAGGAVCRLGDASCASAHAGGIQRAARGGDGRLHGSLRRLQQDHGNHFVGTVLRQAGGAPPGADMDAVERSIGAARGGGHGLDASTRTRMESSFGVDFGGVRIHTDARADALGESLAARAFATGNDVFFRQGEYNPGASSGRELLAHELTHVVQQNGGGVQRKMTVSQPGDPQEVEADRMASEVMRHEHAAEALQRQPEAPPAHDDDEKKRLAGGHDAGAASPGRS